MMREGYLDFFLVFPGLPLQIQDDLVRLCGNPFFMFDDDKDEQRKRLPFETETAATSPAVTVVPKIQSLPGVEAGGPKFQVHITAASLTALDVKLAIDTSGLDGANAGNVLPKGELGEATAVAVAARDLDVERLLPQIVRNVSPNMDAAVGTVAPPVKAPDSMRLSTGINRAAAKSASTHRKISLSSKKARVKRERDGTGAEVDSQVADPPKECPFFTVVTAEVSTDSCVFLQRFVRENLWRI